MSLAALAAVPWLVYVALLLEAVFYFAPAFAAFRTRFNVIPRWLQALLIFGSGLLPVLLLNSAQGIEAAELPLLVTALGIACAWFFVLPARPLTDVLLLALLTSFILLPWFQPLFPTPLEKVKLVGLSKLLWLRVGIAIFLFPRRFNVPGCGLWPERRDWMIGVQQFLLFLAVMLPIALYAKVLRFQLPKVDLWLVPLLTIATFLGAYLFVAWGEEFLVRGVLQSVLSKELGGAWRGLIIASLFFGLIHLPFRNFPNWKFAAMSALAGVFYGIAFNRAKSLRAGMITHALVVTCWTILFARSL